MIIQLALLTTLSGLSIGPVLAEPAVQARPKTVPKTSSGPKRKTQKPQPAGQKPAQLSGLSIPRPIRVALPDFRQLKAQAMSMEGTVKYQKAADAGSDLWFTPQLEQRFVEGEYLRTREKGWLDLRLVQVGFGRMIANTSIAVQKVERKLSPALQLKLVSNEGGFLFRRASSLQRGWDFQILIEGYGVVTANKGTAWSVRQWIEKSFPNGKRVERRITRILVAKGEVRAMYDSNRQVAIIKAGQFMEFADRRVKEGPTRFVDSDLLQLTELVNLGLLKLPTVFVPPIDARDDRSIALPMDAFLGRIANVVFARGVDGRPVGRFLPGNLDFLKRDTPSDSWEAIRESLGDQGKQPSDFLGNVQVIARLKVLETDFREAPLNAEQQARLGRKVSQRATVKVALELTDVLTDRTITREVTVEKSSRESAEARGQTMAEKATNAPLFANACSEAAVRAFYEAAIDSDLRWRMPFSPQSPDSGNFTIPNTIGVYPGQRFTILRADGRERPAEVEVTSVQRGNATTVVFVRILSASDRTRYVPRPGDLIEEQLDF